MTASRVPIVDDDRDFAEGLAEYLELCGHRVDIAFTGEGGIEAAGRTAYDTILMDVGLPGLSGVESLRAIKRFQPEVRCFLLTGYSADHDSLQAVEAGAAEILTKPVNPEELSRRLAARPPGDR